MRLSFLIYDNDSTVNDFPLGIGYLIASLRRHGFPEEDIHIYNMDVYHYSDEQLLDYLRTNQFDVLAIGMIAGYWQYRQLKRMFNAINQLDKRPTVVLGGYMFTPEPEYFLKTFGADYVLLGEGEQSLPRFLDMLAGTCKRADVPGLAWIENSELHQTERLKPIKDIDSLPFPAWDRFPIDNYVSKVRIPGPRGQRSMPVLSSRGCAYKCSFCYRMEPGYRMRSLESIIEECKILIKDYHINAICFRDELLMVTPQRAIEFAEAMIKAELNVCFDIDGRLNAATPEALQMLKRAGCVYINYGVESLDQTVLDNMNKNQTVEEIIHGVEATRDAGIHPGLNVIFGIEGDNRETAMKTVEFLLKYNTYGELRTLKPVTPYPGAPLYDRAIELGLIKDCRDFYENKHLNSDRFACNFTDVSDDELYQILMDANEILIRAHFNHVIEKNLQAHRDLYFGGDINFRGVRH